MIISKVSDSLEQLSIWTKKNPKPKYFDMRVLGKALQNVKHNVVVKLKRIAEKARYTENLSINPRLTLEF